MSMLDTKKKKGGGNEREDCPPMLGLVWTRAIYLVSIFLKGVPEPLNILCVHQLA